MDRKVAVGSNKSPIRQADQEVAADNYRRSDEGSFGLTARDAVGSSDTPKHLRNERSNAEAAAIKDGIATTLTRTDLHETKKDRVADHSCVIKNLAKEVKEDELRDLFGAIALVENVVVVREESTGTPKGIAFVKFKSSTDVVRAIKEFDGTTIYNQNIRVEKARPSN